MLVTFDEHLKPQNHSKTQAEFTVVSTNDIFTKL